MISVVVLAAGEGTRMVSATPKVLHRIGGRTLLGHVLAAAAELGQQRTAVVVGHGREQVEATLPDGVRPVVQADQRGTGHAARLALDALPEAAGSVLILYGDTPLLRAETLRGLVEEHDRTGAAATLLTARAPDPTGYGRVIRDSAGAVVRIVEQRDATAAEAAVDEINTGVAVYAAGPLRDALKALASANAAGEEYLTDVIAAFVADGQPVRALEGDYADTAGVNDRAQLAAAGSALRDRVVGHWMRAGVTVVDPASTWIDVCVTLEPDTTLYPGVGLYGATRVERGAAIGPDCTLTDTAVRAGATVLRTHAELADIGPGASVGPFAYLRPGARLERDAKVGTYVEVKAATIGPGSKVPHLSYVGDATIGADVNIGAASVFVNYDGVRKQRSTVDDGARTGADNMFVAPVHVGAGAYTGAGTIVREDVPPGALAVSEGARQRTIEGWTERKRAGTPSAEAARRALGHTGDGTDAAGPSST